MKIRLFLIICLSWLWHWTHPEFVQLWVGRCQEDDLRFLRAHRATVVLTRHGVQVQADAQGLLAVADWEDRMRMQRDLIQQNLANCKTLLTCDGTPYRRVWLDVSDSGESVVRQDQGDFRWVYDPTNPAAVAEGSHKGYVAFPNVNENFERSSLQLVNERLQRIHEGFLKLQERVGAGDEVQEELRQPISPPGEPLPPDAPSPDPNLESLLDDCLAAGPSNL
jgi:hypothetical protein